MKTTIQLFTPESSFKRCEVTYAPVTLKGYLYALEHVKESHSGREWPVDSILQLNDHSSIDEQIAKATQNEYSKSELGVDLEKVKPTKKRKPVQPVEKGQTLLF